jgi:hypothetical protein
VLSVANETFLSYARKDKDKVYPIFEALKAKGLDPWLDIDDIRPAHKWEQSILIAIQACDNFVYCLSNSSLESQFCDWELTHALLHNKRLIPVLVDNVEVSRVPKALSELNWIILDNRFDAAIKDLIEAIELPIGESWGVKLNSKIRIVRKRRLERIITLNRSEYLIGRSPKGDVKDYGQIVLSDPSAQTSRTHCRLSLRQDRWHVVNFKNFAYLNGHLLKEGEFKPLRHGDKISIFNNSLVYEEVRPEEHSPGLDDRETAL